MIRLYLFQHQSPFGGLELLRLQMCIVVYSAQLSENVIQRKDIDLSSISVLCISTMILLIMTARFLTSQFDNFIPILWNSPISVCLHSFSNVDLPFETHILLGGCQLFLRYSSTSMINLGKGSSYRSASSFILPASL